LERLIEEKLFTPNKMNLGTDIFLKIFGYYEDILREQARKNHFSMFFRVLSDVKYRYTHRINADTHAIDFNLKAFPYSFAKVCYYKRANGQTEISKPKQIVTGDPFIVILGKVGQLK
jgi:hypothetical protein